MLNILLVHRYYYPDTPAYAVMLKDIAERLSVNHKVRVLSSYPSYYGSSTKGIKKKETVNNVQVNRIKLLPEKNRNFSARLANTLLFAIAVFFKILFRPKYDVITVATTPPIIMAMVVRVACFIKGSKYIYHCQDIYPEIAFYNGNLKSKPVFKALRKIDKRNNIKAEKIVVLSNDMKDTLVQERQIYPDKIEIINNFIRTNANSKEEFSYKDYGLETSDFKIVFCGNLGKLQNLYTIIDLAKTLQDYPKIKFVFIGNGVESEKLKAQAGDLLNKTVFFLGYIKSDIAINALKQSHLGVVSISEPTYKTAYPSKTMTYLNAGLPTMAMVNDRSQLANFITENNLGIVVKPNDIKSMKIKILEYYNGQVQFNSNHIYKIAHNTFGREPILNKWSELIKSIN